MQECKNIEIFKSVKNDLGAANFKRNKITQNGTVNIVHMGVSQNKVVINTVESFGKVKVYDVSR